MKQKLRKVKILFLLTILSFVGCQPEEEVVEQNNYQNSFTIERISENEFKKKAPKAFGKMELLKQNFSNNTHQRTVNINNEFSVDTDEIVQITKGNKVSYTLPIYRTNENGLVENLVLSLQNDNSFAAKIITYNLSQSEKGLLQNGMFVDVNNKIQVQNLDNANSIAGNIFARTSSTCYEVQTEYEMCCYNVHSTLDVQNGERCKCPNPPTEYTYTITAVACEEDNGGGNTTPTNTDPIDYTAPSDGTSSSGGNGDGSTGTGTPNDEDSTNNENDPVDNLGDEDLTIPIIRNPTPPTPCDELNKMTGNSNIKNTYTGPNGLNSKVGEAIEYGFAFRRGQNYDTFETVQNDINNPAILKMPSGGNVYGGSHTHPDPNLGCFPMFPAPDIKYLDDIALQYNWNGTIPRDRNYAMFVLTLTVAGGTYAIKIEDWLKFRTIMNDKNKYIEMKDIIEKRFDRIGTTNETKLTKALLKILSKYNIGIGLYKADPDFNNWNKLLLADPNDENSQLINIPCAN